MVWYIINPMGLSAVNAYTGGALGLILSAGPVAKAVVFILFIFSIVSWTIMFVKVKQLRKVEKDGEGFLNIAKDSESFKRLIASYRDRQNNIFYRLTLAAYKEITARQKENPKIEEETIPAIENALRINIVEEMMRLERRVSFLATTANAAPFIGLFGTVWGIMDSFREIGLRGSTSLAIVAPGISEALIATAIGLAAAIPAVLGYNYFIGRLKRINSMMENASLHIINILGK